MGSLVSVRYLGEEKCVFLSKDLLTPIQVTLTGFVKMKGQSLILIFRMHQGNVISANFRWVKTCSRCLFL